MRSYGTTAEVKFTTDTMRFIRMIFIVLWVVLMIATLVYMIVAIGTDKLTDFIEKNWFLMLIYTYLAFFIGRHKARVITPIRIERRDSEITIIYERMNRNDKLSDRVETYKMSTEGIDKVQVNRKIGIISIQGISSKNVVYSKDSRIYADEETKTFEDKIKSITGDVEQSEKETEEKPKRRIIEFKVDTDEMDRAINTLGEGIKIIG